MFERRKIADDFSKAAAIYDENALLQHRVLARLLAEARAFIGDDACILDAGCGTGRLGQMLPALEVIQLDIAPGMCRYASATGNPAVNGDIVQLPFADNYFDAVFSSLVLQWLPDREGAIREMRRVVKKKGILAVSTFGETTLQELKMAFAAFDGYPHVSPFAPVGQGWHTEAITEYFEDIYAIMRHLKNIGAHNKAKDRSKALMTPRKLHKIEQFYHDHFGVAGKLPVTWEVAYRIEEKGN